MTRESFLILRAAASRQAVTSLKGVGDGQLPDGLPMSSVGWGAWFAFTSGFHSPGGRLV